MKNCFKFSFAILFFQSWLMKINLMCATCVNNRFKHFMKTIYTIFKCITMKSPKKNALQKYPRYKRFRVIFYLYVY